MPDRDDVAQEQMRGGIRQWISTMTEATGGGLRRATPPTIIAFLTASALAPIALPFLGPATGVVTTAGVAVLGGMGGNFLADVLASTARRLRTEDRSPDSLTVDELRALLVEELDRRVEPHTDGVGGSLQEMSRFLHEIDGIRVAVLAAVESGESGVQEALTAGFVSLGRDFDEFGWMLTTLANTASEIQRTLSEHVARGQRQLIATERMHHEIIMLRMSLPRTDIVNVPEPERESPSDAECPYPGLLAFGPEDAPWFFGRKGLTAVLVGRLAANAEPDGVVTVLGASGSGKSSLVRAGLTGAVALGNLPLQGSPRPPPRIMMPGEDPIPRLAEQLGPELDLPAEELVEALVERPEEVAAGLRSRLVNEDSSLLLVIDQGEELFTQCTSATRRRSFLKAVAALTVGKIGSTRRVFVVFAMRSDFVARLAEYEQTRRWPADPVIVTAMNKEDLRQAIREPARVAGLALEPELVTRLIADLGVSDEELVYPPGALPRLGHALRETWENREGTTLTVRGYQRAGAIGGAIRQAAEAAWTEHSGGQDLFRSILTHLVAVPEDADAVRHRMRMDQLLDRVPLAMRSDAEEVVSDLVRRRLLTRDRDTVEISHEALLSNWPRLRDWIRADREKLVHHQRLAEAARLWHTENRPLDLLWRGDRLGLGEGLHLTEVERQFLAEGVLAESRRTRTRRLTAAAVVALLLAVVVGGVVVSRQQAVAQEQRSQAERQRKETRSRQLAADSALVFTTDQRGGQLRALAAWHTAPTIEARGAVIGQQLNTYVGPLRGHNETINRAAVTPDGTTAATGGLTEAVLWDVRTRRERARVPVGGLVGGLAFSGDGKILATGTGDKDKGLRTWRVDSGGPLLSVPAAVSALAFHPRDNVIATGEADRAVHLRDAATGADLIPPIPHGDFISTIAFSSDGSLLAWGDHTSTVRIWDLAQRQRSQVLKGHTASPTGVAFSPDGSRLATVGLDSTLRFWNTSTGDQVFRVDLSVMGSSVTYVPGTNRVAVAGGTKVILVDTRTYEDTVIDGLHTGVAFSVTASRSGEILVSAGQNGKALVYRPRNGRLNGHTGPVINAAFDPTGRSIVTSGDNTVRRWDTSTFEQTGALPLPDGVRLNGVARARNGRIVTSSTDGTVRLWDPEAGTQLQQITITDGAPRMVDLDEAGTRVAVIVTDHLDPARKDLPPGRPGVRVWDLGDDSVRTVYEGAPGGSIDFAPNTAGHGSWLAFGVAGNVVRVVDTRDGSTVRDLDTRRRDGAAMVSTTFNSSGTRLAASSTDQSVSVWDLEGAGAVRTINYPTQPRGVAFSPDGSLLATGGIDPVVRLWNSADLSPHAILDRHVNRTNGLEFSPDGRTLASASDDGQVILWQTSAEEASKQICAAIQGPGLAEEWSHLFPEMGRPPC